MIEVHDSDLSISDIESDSEIIGTILGWWDEARSQQSQLLYKWDEVRKYLYAVDTRHSSGLSTPWKNKTTRPKLMWIKEKMRTNMIRKLIPSDDFFRWIGYPSDKYKEQAKAIQHLMKHKLRHPFVKFRATMTRCLDDLLETGNAFAGIEYIIKKQKSIQPGDNKEIIVFKGPRPFRIPPQNVVIDPAANTYEETPIAYSMVYRKAEFYEMAQDNASYDPEVVEKVMKAHGARYTNEVSEYLKDKNRSIDGTTIYDHWKSGRVELIEYYGPVSNPETGDYIEKAHITIIDRMWVLVNEENPTYLGIKPISFASYRKRPENLWGMGPFENLIGMQYRIDHLENAKSDALDMCVYPIRKITGDATQEEYKLQPGEEWYVPLNGNVELIYPDPKTFMFESDILSKEQEMEEFSGVPKETAGFRTPGEKTKFEVGSLLEHAQEFPDEKIMEFESEFIEPLLNLSLELVLRNLDSWDIDSIPEEDIDTWNGMVVDAFKQDGRLYPIGTKHARQRQNKIQNTMLLLQNIELAPEHISKINALKVLAEESGMEEDNIVKFGIGLEEEMLLQQKRENIEKEASRENPDQ